MGRRLLAWIGDNLFTPSVLKELDAREEEMKTHSVPLDLNSLDNLTDSQYDEEESNGC